MVEKILINKLSFTHKAIKRFKKEKDIIREKEILEELRFLVLNGLDSSFQERIMNKFNGFELIDYLEHHKKQRIIILKKKINEILIIDILFDHLGRDKLDYERYWSGEEIINFEEKIILNRNLINDVFIERNYQLFFNKIK